MVSGGSHNGKIRAVWILGPRLAVCKSDPTRQTIRGDWAERITESLGTVGTGDESPEVSRDEPGLSS